MNYNEIIKRLHEPFSAKEIEWKIQVTSQDKKRGMAVAYMDARAVQKRLDEVVGAFNWKNVYSLWHDNFQICGISIFNDDRNEWITKFDGAENSDIEPIKGGLSDSFKRAATVWGIVRYLYEIDGVWVEIEPKQYKSDYTAQIAESEVKLKALYAEHAKLSKTLENTVVGYQCPVCATVITEKNVGTVRSDIQKQLTALVDDGKRAKADLANIITRDNAARDEFEKKKAEAIQQENNRLAELNQRLQEINVALEIDKEDFSECLSILEEQIKEQEVHIAYGNWTEEQATYFKELEENKKSLGAQIQAIS